MNNNLQFQQQQNMINMQQQQSPHHMNMRLQHHQQQHMPPPIMNQSQQQQNMMMMQQQQQQHQQPLLSADQQPGQVQPNNHRNHHHHHHPGQLHLQQIQQQQQHQVQSPSSSNQTPAASPHLIQQQQSAAFSSHHNQQQQQQQSNSNFSQTPFLAGNIYPNQQQQQSQANPTPTTQQTPLPSPLHHSYHSHHQQQQQHQPPPIASHQQHFFGHPSHTGTGNHNHNMANLQMQAEYRIYDMNKRLASRPEHDFLPIGSNGGSGGPNSGLGNNDSAISVWWESFVSEFFEEDAKMSIRNVIDDNVPKTFTIGRTLIPRFFRSIYDGGVTDLYFQLASRTQLNANLNAVKHQEHLLFESEMCTMTTKYGRPMYAIIFTEGHLQVEFSMLNEQNTPATANASNSSFPLNDSIRIKSWTFNIRRHQELIPRSTIAIQQDAAGIEQISKNITKAGISNHTLNYLKLCTVLEPMQELMSRSKMTQMPPRECLKVSASQKMNRMNSGGGQMIAPPPPPPNHHQHQHQSRINLMQNDDLISIKNEPMLMNPNRNMMQQQQQQPQQTTLSGINNQTPAPISAIQNSTADARTPSKRRKRKSSPGPTTPNASESIKKEGPGSASKSKKANAEAKAAAAAAAAQAAININPIQTPNHHLHHHHQQQQQQHQYFNMGHGMIPPGTPMSSIGGDVMIVGEPSLMGGDFGEEDERLITRLENNQFDVNMSLNPNMHHQQPHHSRSHTNRINPPNQFNAHLNNQLNDESKMQIFQQQQSNNRYPQFNTNFPGQMPQLNDFQMQQQQQPPPNHPSRPPSLQSQLSLPVGGQSSSIYTSIPPRPQSSSSHLSQLGSQLLLDQQQQIVSNPNMRISTPSPTTSNPNSSVPILNNALLNNLGLTVSSSNNPNSPPVLTQQQQQQHPPPSLTPQQQQQQFTAPHSNPQDEIITNAENILNNVVNECNNNESLNETNLDSLVANADKSPNSLNKQLNNDNFNKIKSNDLMALDVLESSNASTLINGIININQPQQQPTTSSSSIASSSSSSSPTLYSSSHQQNHHQQQQMISAANLTAASNSLTSCSPPQLMNNNNGKSSADLQQQQQQQQQSQAISLNNY